MAGLYWRKVHVHLHPADFHWEYLVHRSNLITWTNCTNWPPHVQQSQQTGHWAETYVETWRPSLCLTTKEISVFLYISQKEQQYIYTNEVIYNKILKTNGNKLDWFWQVFYFFIKVQKLKKIRKKIQHPSIFRSPRIP